MKKNNTTTFSVNMQNIRFTYELKTKDPNAAQVANALRTLMIAMGFAEKTVHNHLGTYEWQ